MANFTIYPAIDLSKGKVVRLRQGKRNQQTQYSHSPSAVAREWTDQGAQWIHVVNLDGAFGESSTENESAVKSILEQSAGRIKVQLGGGLRKTRQIEAALKMGVSRIVLGTAAIENPDFGEEMLGKYGGDKIALGFDALDGELMIRGWQSTTGKRMIPLAERLVKAGAEIIIYTNIKKDGMQTGVDWENAKDLADQTGVQVIASGGTSSLADIKAVCKAGLTGVIIGRALYEENFTLKEAINVC